MTAELLRGLQITEEDEEAIEKGLAGPPGLEKVELLYQITEHDRFQHWLRGSRSGVCRIDSSTRSEINHYIFMLLCMEIQIQAQRMLDHARLKEAEKRNSQRRIEYVRTGFAGKKQHIDTSRKSLNNQREEIEEEDRRIARQKKHLEATSVSICPFSCSKHDKGNDRLGGPRGLVKAILCTLVKSETLKRSKRFSCEYDQKKHSFDTLLKVMEDLLEVFALDRPGTKETIFIVIEGCSKFEDDPEWERNLKAIISLLKMSTERCKEGLKVLINVTSNDKHKDNQYAVEFKWNVRRFEWVCI
jgi:hypothetical protein